MAILSQKQIIISDLAFSKVFLYGYLMKGKRINYQGGFAYILIFLIVVALVLGATAFYIYNKNGGFGRISFFGQFSPKEPSLEISPTTQPEAKNVGLKGVLALKEGSIAKLKAGIWEEIAKGTVISEGDVVRTGYKAKAVVELDDGSALRLDQNTQVTFSSLGGEVILLTQDDGKVYHRVSPGKLVYNVKSLNTVATALGTAFSVATDAKQQITEVAVYENKVALATEGNIFNTEGNISKAQVISGEMAVVGKSEKVEVEKIPESEKKEAFIAWNKTLDQQSASAGNTTPTAKPTIVSSSEGPLVLKAEARSGGALVKWIGDSSNGFKVCLSEQENPSYPANTCVYKNASEKSHEFGSLQAGKTYHFRVGVYGKDDKVSIYSNDVSIVPQSGSESSNISNTSLSLIIASNKTGKVKMLWTLNGSEANGFKVCYSEQENPTYPENTCIHKNAGERTHIEENMTSGKIYHFRVGLYGKDDKISIYSPDMTVTVK